MGQLREQMGNDEFVRWGVYHGRKAQRAEMEQKRSAAKAKAGQGKRR